jgi:hypothetical protein
MFRKVSSIASRFAAASVCVVAKRRWITRGHGPWTYSFEVAEGAEQAIPDPGEGQAAVRKARRASLVEAIA